jgi:hypothetical protein
MKADSVDHKPPKNYEIIAEANISMTTDINAAA